MEGHQKSRRCRKQDGERGGQDGKERLAMENIGCGRRGVCGNVQFILVTKDNADGS
ncbi:hypothetical protein C364_00001 [Cryptococcus neoformans Bt63]|nr:hypothetical protein C364_00001 [Cryptococcus neoformans var. grubii Bt63]